MFIRSFIRHSLVIGACTALSVAVGLTTLAQASSYAADTLVVRLGSATWESANGSCHIPIRLQEVNRHDIKLVFLEIVYPSGYFRFHRLSAEETMTQEWLRASHVFAGKNRFDTLRVVTISQNPLRGKGDLLNLDFTVLTDSMHEQVAEITRIQLLGQREPSLVVIDRTGFTSGLAQRDDKLPIAFGLEQNYPNPFNAGTKIRFRLPVAAEVRIRVIDILGEIVAVLADRKFEGGYHELVWSATNQQGVPVASGAYFYEIKAGDFIHKRKMLVLR